MIRDAHCSNRLQISSIQSFDQKRPKIRLKSTSGKKSEVNEAAIRCQWNLLHRCCTFAPSTTLVGSVPCQLWNSTYLKFYFWQYYRVYSPIVFGKKRPLHQKMASSAGKVSRQIHLRTLGGAKESSRGLFKGFRQH